MTGGPSGPAPRDDEFTFRYEVAPRFLEGLERAVPSAPLRLAILEQRVPQRLLDRALRAYRLDRSGDHSIYIDGEQGLLKLDPFAGAPECMVMFEIDAALEPGSIVLIWGIRGILREGEDDS